MNFTDADSGNLSEQEKQRCVIEKEIDGCKVRLFFSDNPNERIERIVLDNLMLVFERRMGGSLQN